MQKGKQTAGEEAHRNGRPVGKGFWVDKEGKEKDRGIKQPLGGKNERIDLAGRKKRQSSQSVLRKSPPIQEKEAAKGEEASALDKKRTFITPRYAVEFILGGKERIPEKEGAFIYTEKRGDNKLSRVVSASGKVFVLRK